MTNKIDVIYIDPPYNTGKNDFVYPDDFEYSDNQLMEMFGLNDEELEKLDSIKSSSSHSAWLTFMYPRILLARKLLSDNGLIFISINQNENANLKLIMDEIFGENNFIESYVWESTFRPDNSSDITRHNSENILLYSKNIKNIKKLVGTTEKSSGVPSLTKNSMGISTLNFKANQVDTYLKDGIYDPGLKENGYKLNDQIKVFKNKIINDFSLSGRMYWSQDTLDREISNGTKIIIKSERFVPYVKKNITTSAPNTIIPRDLASDVYNGKSEISKLFDGNNVFSYPKPTDLIKYLLREIDDKNLTILDFFAGSGTTADAVIQLNKDDGGKRKFILVQLHEPTFDIKNGLEVTKNKDTKTALQLGYKYIDEISMARIKKAAQKLDLKGKIFDHYSVIENVSSSVLDKIDNFNPDNSNLFNDTLNDFSASNLGVKGNATGEDSILTTWIVKDGYSFDIKKEKVEFNDYTGTLVDDTNLYLIKDGWNKDATKELVNKIGNGQLKVQTIVLFGYSFNIAELKELEIALKQLDNKVNLVKRY